MNSFLHPSAPPEFHSLKADYNGITYRFSMGQNLSCLVVNIIGQDTSDQLRKLEDDIDIPPDVFLHDLEFIAEEPPEGRRAYAAERFKLMLDHLRTTKWDTYYCIPANRHAVQELFGGAIRTLLKRLPEIESPKAESSGLRLVAGDLLDRITETVKGG